MERGFLVQQFISNNIWHRHLHISIFTFLPPLKIFYQLWTSSVQIKFCGSGEKKRAHMHTIYTDAAVQHPKVALLTWKNWSVWVLGWEGGCRADIRHVSHVRDVMNGCYRTYGRHTQYWKPVQVPSSQGKGPKIVNWWFLQGEDA